jgi:hypothetical protein
MPTQKWDQLPQEVFELRGSLENTNRLAPSVSSAIGFSMWTLLKSTGLEPLQPFSHSIENGFPDVYRTLSRPHPPSKQRWSSSIRQSWGGSVEDPGLPPIDGGRRAWLFMIGAFMIEGLLWGTFTFHIQLPDLPLTVLGFPLTFGVFQAYYEKTQQFGGSQNPAIVGTLCTVRRVSIIPATLLANRRRYRVYHT